MQVAIQFVPLQRHRHAGARHRTRHVGRHHRGALAVLQEVHVDLAATPARQPLHAGDVGMLARHHARHRLHEQAHLIVAVAGHQRQVDVQSGGAGGLEGGIQADAAQHLAGGARHPLGVGEGGVLGVQVQHREVGLLQAAAAREPGMQLDAAQVDQVEQSLQVVADELPVVPGIHLHQLHPVRHPGGSLALEEGLALDAVRVAVHVHRPLAQVGEQELGHLLVEP